MAATWMSVDVNWPTFTKDEPVEMRFYKLQNYLWTLTEQLKYTLENLDTTNWNATSLSDYGDEATADIRRSIAMLTSSIGDLQEAIEDINDELEETANALTTINEQLALNRSMLNVTSETAVTIGGEGKTVEINGTVTINGREV